MGIHKTIWIALILSLVLLPAVCGVGLRPAEVQEYFEPGLSKYVNLKIQNTEGKNLKVTAYAKGELADYISFPSQIIDISKEEKEAVFTYKIELPKDLERKGELVTEIVVVAIPEKSPGQTALGVNMELVSTLKLVVPYDDKYIEPALYMPKMEYGKESSIIIDMQNHGSKRIVEAIAVVDIYDAMNQKIMVLRSESMPLDPKEKKTIRIPYMPELPNGVYHAKLTIIYDGKNAGDEKLFSVGGPEVIIDYISVDTFTLGGIARFDIIIESKWNQPIYDLFGTVSVQDKNDKIYTTYKTANTDLEPFGKQTIQAYWDTNKVSIGPYTMKVDLNYLDRQDTFSSDITVLADEIRTSSLTGMAISGGEKVTSDLLNTQALLLLIILLITAFFGVYLYNMFRKK